MSSVSLGFTINTNIILLLSSVHVLLLAGQWLYGSLIEDAQNDGRGSSSLPPRLTPPRSHPTSQDACLGRPSVFGTVEGEAPQEMEGIIFHRAPQAI